MPPDETNIERAFRLNQSEQNMVKVWLREAN